jgi:hypothetical protein
MMANIGRTSLGWSICAATEHTAAAIERATHSRAGLVPRYQRLRMKWVVPAPCSAMVVRSARKGANREGMRPRSAGLAIT